MKTRRYLFDSINQLALNRNKMAFVSGPRQVGKTTLAKSLAQNFDQSLYKNWDETDFRRQWASSFNRVSEEFNLNKPEDSKLLILDEIHKSKGWKQKVKGLYDEQGEDLSIIVTGSARLNIFKKGGDSLMGRYYNFRLHPFSYGEMIGSPLLEPTQWRDRILQKPSSSYSEKELERIFRFTGFPEPYLAASPKILNLWRRSRNEKVIREDLRDLSRLPELSQIEVLASLLHTKIGSPLSIQSLREDLDVAHDTVSRWLKYLNELYYFFELKPWSNSVPRSLKKEGKIYLYDWTEIPGEGHQFENMVACHLQKSCHFWTDTGEGNFELFYLRNKEKQEIDFLIVRDKKPWLCLEAKMSDGQIHHATADRYTGYLKCPFVQIVREPKLYRKIDNKVLSSAHHIFWGLA